MDSGFFMATFFDPAHKPIIVGKGDHRLFNKLFLCIHYHISLRLFVCTRPRITRAQWKREPDNTIIRAVQQTELELNMTLDG